LIHLEECNENFIPPLDQKVDLRDYSKKLAEKSITFEAWDGKKLIGLVAAYFNDLEQRVGFITNVSVVKDHHGKGIARALMDRCIEYAKKENFRSIKLEVSENNEGAIQLYKKLSFTPIELKDQTVKMILDLN